MALELYKATQTFPREEIFGLTSQIRRAALSIPTNIAEGCGREGGADLARFLQIAIGSASELEYQLLVANELQMLKSTEYRRFAKEVTDVKRMLTGLIRTLRAKR